MDFPTTLATAVARSGHSLGRLSAELRRRGTPVSASTLSAWQTGLSRPEREASLAAVAALEDLLGLPPRTLVNALPARRPRGRHAGSAAVAEDRVRSMWRVSDAVRDVLARLDADWRDLNSPTVVSNRTQAHVGANGQEQLFRVTRVLKAGSAPAERMIYVIRYGCLPQVPLVSESHGCRPARFRGDATNGVFAFEFLLDPPLAAGEFGLVDFVLQDPPGQEEQHHSIRAMDGTREILLSVHFDPGFTPAGCHAYYQPEAGAPARTIRQTEGLATGRTFQYIAYDPEPGVYGIRWD
ncbi:XRE family transcriptional regulator [Streptomyces sp. NA04227]|uniref:XRE family transcriptional regulator n=1 Tax=Streptomyces sp. NA04227 TaxID=2742136 RepID=UPI001590358A|nr:XRE family transcriptional regulator [Streptomyces sp. NA04227]QKW06186.1 XRE family transcriptional regulator [Streptomyces sp. NA04227]